MANFPPYYKFNFGYALLGASMNTSTSFMTIQGGSNFPYNVSAYFKVVVWSKNTYTNPADDPQAEIMTAVWSGSANVFTVTRGDEGTAPSAHNVEDGVAAVVTAGLIQSVDSWSPRGGTVCSTPGVNNVTLPYGITRIYAKAWGPGGCGGVRATSAFGTVSIAGGGGGGGGGYCEGALDVSGTVQVIVGTGGITAANNGGTAALPINTQVVGSTVTMIAYGGSNGGNAANSSTPGAGGLGGGSLNSIISMTGFTGTNGSTATGPTNNPPTLAANAVGGLAFGSTSGIPGSGGTGQAGNLNQTTAATDGKPGLVFLYW